MIVGGNIEGFTRVMTTAIALETSEGDLPLALALGLVLMAIVLAVNAAAQWWRACRGARGPVTMRSTRQPSAPGRDAAPLCRRRRAILHGLDLAIEAGPPLVILGPNGARQERAAAPAAWPRSSRPAAASPGAASLAARGRDGVPAPGHAAAGSVLANVAYPLKLAGPARTRRGGRPPWPRWSGVAPGGARDLAPRGACPGGEQQRLALARVEATGPEGGVPRRALRQPRPRRPARAVGGDHRRHRRARRQGRR